MPADSISCASSMTFAACSKAFEGMQPTLRQTPPSCGQRSISAVFIPRSAARNAAVYPPGPEPSTTTSKSYDDVTDGRRTADGDESGTAGGTEDSVEAAGAR